ncbi:MAG: ADOP family duplicated permease [Deltaproteobacteria bacterium]
MSLLKSISAGLRAMFRKEQVEREMDEELKGYLDAAVEEKARSGMSRKQAVRAAKIEMGSVEAVKEEIRSAGWESTLETLRQDIRYGLRQLRRSPAFTIVAVVTLALGIGANTAIFSAVNALLLNPYPFPQVDRVLWVEARHASGKNSGAGVRDFLDWREQNDVFEEMAIVQWTFGFTLTGSGEPQRIIGAWTTQGFLRVLKIEPVLGRFFTAEEDRPGGARVAVLTYAAWQRRFGGRGDVLGQKMTLDGEPFTIIGVMPSGFAFPGVRTCEFLLPLRPNPASGRYQHQYDVIARMKPGVTFEHAQFEMNTIASGLEREYPATNTGWRIQLKPLGSAIAKEAGQPLLLLFAAVGFVLLLACANVAGLLLARASARAKEIAVRTSLGAGRIRIIRQMLTESVLLSLAGGVCGLLFAVWVMDVLRGTAPEDLAFDTTLRLNWTVLLFTLSVSLMAGAAFGIAPAWLGSKTDLNAALKGEANGWSGARSRGRWLSGLVAAEVALSLVLLASAGLVLRSLIRALHVETGLRIEHVLTFGLDLPYPKYSTPQQTAAFFGNLLDRLRTSPGIDSAAAVMTLPMTGAMTGGAFQIEGRPKAPDWVDTLVQYNIASPGFFRSMGISLQQGRDFNEHDTATSLPVAIINDALARRFFPNEDPIGQRYKDSYDRKIRTIVGVVASYKHQQPTRDAFAMTFSPLTQSPSKFMWVTVRTQGDPAKVASAVRGIVGASDRDLPVLKMQTMRQVVADSLSQPELLACFLGAFAVFALLLAAIGVYGTISYSVSQRTREIGTRMTLGAQKGDILSMIVRQGLKHAFLGIAVGTVGALALTQFLRSLLYGVKPTDPLTFAAVAMILVGVALFASYVPARRATKVDPMVALRYE